MMTSFLLSQLSRRCVVPLLLCGVMSLSVQAATVAVAQDAPAAQSGAPKAMPSPPVTTETMLNDKTIIVKYNSPAMRGRKVMGELVPYGKVWRTGANPATSFVTAGDIMVGNLRVPAGSYTLFTLPAQAGSPWMLILNKQTGQWGLEYHQEQDLGRVPMKSATLPVPQELMSITFENRTPGSVELHIRWETTDEYVTITPAS